MKIYVSAKLEVGCSFPSIWVRRLITVAELLQKLIIGLPKLQAVQSIPRVGRQLNRRELSNALRHRIRTHRIICPYSSMDCQLGDPISPLRYGLPNVYGKLGAGTRRTACSASDSRRSL